MVLGFRSSQNIHSLLRGFAIRMILARNASVSSVPIIVSGVPNVTDYEKMIYTKALEKWGEVSQIHMCSEEMSELNKELMKSMREGGVNIDRLNNLVDEIADVLITVEELILMWDLGRLVEKRKQYKLSRLERMVSE